MDSDTESMVWVVENPCSFDFSDLDDSSEPDDSAMDTNRDIYFEDEHGNPVSMFGDLLRLSDDAPMDADAQGSGMPLGPNSGVPCSEPPHADAQGSGMLRGPSSGVPCSEPLHTVAQGSGMLQSQSSGMPCSENRAPAQERGRAPSQQRGLPLVLSRISRGQNTIADTRTLEDFCWTIVNSAAETWLTLPLPFQRTRDGKPCSSYMEFEWKHQTHRGHDREVTRVRLWKIAILGGGWVEDGAAHRMRPTPGCKDWQPVQFQRMHKHWTVRHGSWSPAAKGALTINFKFNWPENKTLVKHKCRQLVVQGGPLEFICLKKENAFMHNISVILAPDEADWRRMAWLMMLRNRDAMEVPDEVEVPPLLKLFCLSPRPPPGLPVIVD